MSWDHDDDLPPVTAEEQAAMVAKARETIDHCAVGLAHVGDPVERDDIAELGGSGTLVQANGAFGILTAAHVVRDFIRREERAIGVAFYDGFKGREKVRLGVHRMWLAPEDGRDGPDLAVIVLNPNDASRLSNTHPFYRLDAPERQAQMRDMFAADEGGWLLVGGVGEWSRGPVTPEGSHNVKAFGGLIVGPEFKRERVSEPHDYIEVEINYRDKPESTPQSFGGMSGGGAWHLLPSPDRTMMFYLGGVIFYQSALVDDRRTVFCHGRRSVYNVACRGLAGN